MRRDSNFKQILAAMSGTVLQYYDFSLFGYFTPVIAELYFPAQNQTLSILYAFSLFAVSFLLAPLGSIFFGYIGDNFGRKKALTLSILLMAIPTAMIGILPTYTQIGMAASLLLILCRLIQGFVASGEFTGSAVYLVEQAKSRNPYLLGSLISSSYSIGMLIGSVLATIVTLKIMPTWAWRLPFLLALIAVLLIFYMRKNLSETQEFLASNKKNKKWFWTALINSPRAVMATILMGWFVGIVVFGTYVFSVTYLTEYAHLQLSTAIIIVSLALLLDACLEPFIAMLADKYGGLWITGTGIAGFAVFSYPLFQMLATGNVVLIIMAMISLTCLIAITCAPLNGLLVRLFPAEYRSSGFGVSFNLSIGIFGGTAPLILTGLILWTGNLVSPALYYIGGSFIGLYAISLMKSNKQIHVMDMASSHEY